VAPSPRPSPGVPGEGEQNGAMKRTVQAKKAVKVKAKGKVEGKVKLAKRTV
jgi:hypothetical protein